MRHDPDDTGWVGCDRFVRSTGHSSLTLCTQLYLGGFGLELEYLRSGGRTRLSPGCARARTS
ncbi:transketolase [Streptomyces phaeochromogenes]